MDERLKQTCKHSNPNICGEVKMDVLGIVDIPVWLLYGVLILVMLYLYTSYKQGFFRRIDIHTKPTTLMLGDLPILAKEGVHYVNAQLIQKEGKCFGIFIGNVPYLVVADPEMIKQILVKNFSNFTDRVNPRVLEKRWQSAMNIAPGTHWRFLRSTLSPSFSTGKLRNMTGLVLKCIDMLHDTLEEKSAEGAFDVLPVFSGYTMDVICNTGFGMDVNSQNEPDNMFVKYAKDFSSFRPNLIYIILMFFPELRFISRLVKLKFVSDEAMDFYKTGTQSAFEERKKSGAQFRDLLQLMIQAQNETMETDGDTSEMTREDFKTRGLTDEEIFINSIVFMIAGFETTANTLTWMSYCLANNPDVQEKLITEIEETVGMEKPTYDVIMKMKYLDMVLSETLRLYPATPRLIRKANDDTEICGHFIPKGLDITIAVSALQMLSEFWPEPEKFDPERFSTENEGKIVPYTYLPFGAGPRNCVGLRLAQLEVKITIVSVLQKYRLSLAPSMKIPPAFSTEGHLIRPKNPVILQFHKRERDLPEYQ